MSDSKAKAFEIATLIADHKGLDVVVLDLREIAGWTDYFVLATANSTTHMRGLLQFVEAFVAEAGLDRLNHPIAKDDDSWALLDLGNIVVHVMNSEARAFYELEKLWFKAPAYKIEAGRQAATSAS